MLPWRSNNHAALREIDNLPVAKRAVNPTSRTTGTTSAKTNCIKGAFEAYLPMMIWGQIELRLYVRTTA